MICLEVTIGCSIPLAGVPRQTELSGEEQVEVQHQMNLPLDKEFEDKIESAGTLEDLTRPLQELLSRGYDVWQRCHLMCTKALVAQVDDLRIEIKHREHPPPHFHVRAQSLEATFRIETGELLNGKIDSRHLRVIHWWHERSKQKLINIWNQTRPSDCPVGPIEQ